MLHGKAYRYTSDDVVYAVKGASKGITRSDFFAKGQPCFRASPLTKRYGWGVHCDSEGRIALYAAGSPEYAQLAGDKTLKQVKAMRGGNVKG
jgi:hypothetical protein